MAISLRGTATQTAIASGAASQTWTLNYPSGVAAGDLLFAWFVTNTNANGVATITGWTKIGEVDVGSDTTVALWQRIAGAAETSWTFTTIWDAVEYGMGVVLVLQTDRGQWPENPIAAASAVTASGTVTSLAGPSVDPGGVNGCWHIQFVGTDPGTGGYAGTPDTSPTGVEDFDAKGTGASDAYTFIQHYAQATSAALALDVTVLTSDAYGYCQIAVRDDRVLAAAAGAFTEIGTDAAPKHAKVLNANPAYRTVADPGVYVESGSAATLAYAAGNKTLTADGGAFTVAGTAASPKWGRACVAGAGSHVMTGLAASLLVGFVLSVGAGAFAATGADATPKAARILAASGGAFSFDGTAASLERSRLISAASGSFAVTGQDAAILLGREVAGAAGVYIETGTAVTLTHLALKTLAADSGSLAETGADAALRHAYVLPANPAYRVVGDPASFVLAGTAATLTKSGGAKTLAADSGAFAETGQAASTLLGRRLGGAEGTLVLTGSSADLEHVHILDAAAGAFAVNGTDASPEYGRVVGAAGGSFAITGIAVSPLLGREIAAEAGAYVETGTDATLTRISTRVLAADAGAFSILADSSAVENAITHAWWMEETSGTRQDSVGSADLTDNAGTGYASGVRGNAASLAALSYHYLDNTTVDDLDGLTKLSISAWVAHAVQTSARNQIFGTADTDLSFQWRGTDGSVHFILGANSGYTGTGKIPGTDLHHVAVVYDGAGATNADKLKIWVDGVPQSLSFSGTIPSSITASPAGLQVGLASGGWYASGRIDELYSFHGYALTADDVEYLWRRHFHPFSTTLALGSAFSAGSGSFAETGTAAGLLRSYVLLANPAYKLVGDGAGYSVIGSAATLTHEQPGAYVLSAGAGSYAVTGDDSAAYVDYVLVPVAGSFVETGSAATLTKSGGAYSLAASPASFAVTGAASALLLGRRAAADAGAYSVAGTAASILLGRRVASDPGSVAVAGTAASLLLGRGIGAAVGTYTLTGSAATLTYAQARTLAADSGTFGLSGPAAGLLATHRLNAEGGALTLSGGDVGIGTGRLLLAASGSFALTGQDATLSHSSVHLIVAGSGTFAVSGSDAAPELGRLVSAASGAFVLTGADAVLRYGYGIAAASGAFGVSGGVASPLHACVLAAEGGSLSLAGSDISPELGYKLGPSAGAFSFVGSDVSFFHGRAVVAGAGSYIEVGAAVDLRFSGASVPDTIHLLARHDPTIALLARLDGTALLYLLGRYDPEIALLAQATEREGT